MNVFDILRDSTGDLKIKDGDFVIGESTTQHQTDILLSQKGDFKQWPTLGVGLFNFLLGDDSVDEFKQVVQAEFENDGMEINSLNIKPDGKYNIDANYADNNNIR